MAQKNKHRSDGRNRNRSRGKGAAGATASRPRVHDTPTNPGPSPAARIAGFVFLGVSVVASGILAVHHFFNTSMPGCGPESGCDEATSSAWGRIPWLDYPVSLLGLAFFAAMLVGWGMSRRGVSRGVKWMARVGMLASAYFIVIIIARGFSCPYCIASHVGNGLFWLTIEFAGGAGIALTRPFIAAQATFATLTLVLAGGEWQSRARALQQSEDDLAQSTDDIINQSGGDPNDDAYPAILNETHNENNGFRGRYLHGPEIAPIRLVIFSDYQCPDCRSIHEQVKQILAERDDVSFTAKHFPMCWDCNPYLDRNMHPDACYAARVAEAAGQTWGADTFWQFHNWLFEERRGSVNDQVLFDFCRGLGLSPEETVQFMTLAKNDSRSSWPVSQDIEEGVALGLHFTPMVFINGVELKGWKAPNAIRRAITQVAASNPEPASFRDDRPVPALTKVVDDWRDQPHQVILPDDWPHVRGEAGAPVSIAVFGDYEDDNTAELDAEIRRRIESVGGIEYHFRHFPGNKECNPGIDLSPHPLACFAARAAEAAGRLGGEDGFWSMHDWLLEHYDQLSEGAILDAAVSLGLDRDEFVAVMQEDEVNLAIHQDAQAGRVLVARATLPILVINGKRVPRWKYQEEWLLDELIAAAVEVGE